MALTAHVEQVYCVSVLQSLFCSTHHNTWMCSILIYTLLTFHCLIFMFFYNFFILKKYRDWLLIWEIAYDVEMCPIQWSIHVHLVTSRYTCLQKNRKNHCQQFVHKESVDICLLFFTIQSQCEWKLFNRKISRVRVPSMKIWAGHYLFSRLKAAIVFFSFLFMNIFFTNHLHTD